MHQDHIETTTTTHPKLYWLAGLLLATSMPALTYAQATPVVPAAVLSADQRFVQQAGSGGMAEVEFSELALTNSSSTVVKNFALHMIEAHRANNKELAVAAKQSNLTMPIALDSEHATLRSSLSAKQGPDFDQAYVEAMRSDHRKMADLLEQETHSTDATLKTFATKTLPVVQQHLQMAMKLSV